MPAGQEPSVGRQRIEGTKESQALDEFTDKRIDGDHTFGLQFAERHMNCPLIRAGGAEAIEGQIGAFADAHAGVTNQQKSVAAQIVAAEELLLQELVLLCGEGAWKPLRADAECPRGGSDERVQEAVRVQASSLKMQRRAMSRLM